MGDESEAQQGQGPCLWSHSYLVIGLIFDSRCAWLQSPFSHSLSLLWVLFLHCWFSNSIVSAPWLSVLAWSTCCSGTCWDKSSASTSTCSFGWTFGVSPAAPRTRVRESLISCPGPRDRLAGPAFCPAHRSWKRVWTHYSCVMKTVCRA